MSGQYPDPKSTFLVQGVVVRDPMQGATYVHASIRDGEKLYLDVTCFDDGPLEQFRQLKGGMTVKIGGYLGKRKVKDVVDGKGRQLYETQLLARKLAVTGVGQVAPSPPQYQNPGAPSAPSEAMTYPQWLAYQQSQGLQSALLASPQQPAQHPAQWDGTDNIPF